MNLPVSGATGVIGLAPASDQAAVPGFAELVTALLAGSDVISEEVAQSGAYLSIPGQEGNPGPPDEDPRDDIGSEPLWPALMVHPSLVADALLRHLDQVGGFGPADQTTLGESPSIGTAWISHPVAPPAVALPPTPPTIGQPEVPTEFANGASSLVPIAAPAVWLEPALVPVGTNLAPATPAQSSAEPSGFEPSENRAGDVVGTEPTAIPPATEMAPPAGGLPTTSMVGDRPAPDLRIDPARPRQGGLEGLPAGPGQAGETLPVTADAPTDGGLEIEREQPSQPTSRSGNQGEANAIPPDRTQRDADPARIGMRPAEALSTAARRVEEAVRQLESAPPPSVVTMVIEELDLRLTVAIRPDGVHLSAPGPEAPELIRSLEEALHSRGFDLSGRQRGRHGHEQPEAPVIPSSPRPSTRPAGGLRL